MNTKARSQKEQENQEPETVAQMCRRSGISRKQAHEWIKLAKVPQDEFEAILRGGDRAKVIADINRIKTATVGGHGRTLHPGAHLLDALLALELQLMTEEPRRLLDDLGPAQRAALARVVPVLCSRLLALDDAEL